MAGLNRAVGDRAVGTQFEWRQPAAFRRFYQLLDNETEVGFLRFEETFGTRATAEYGGSRWIFQRTGFWPKKVIVCDSVSPMAIATFTQRWNGGGEMVFASGSRFTLKGVSFWGGEWEFQTDSGIPVVTVQGPRGIIKNRGVVFVSPARAPSRACN